MRPLNELIRFLNKPNILIRELFFPYLLISIRQYLLLKRIAGKNKLIVEIGSYKGGTTMRLAKRNRVIAIDPFIGGWDKTDDLSKEINEDTKKVIRTFLKNIKSKKYTFGFGKQVIWLKEKSEDVLKRWAVPIDGVFIDGDHTYEGVKKDSEWIKHVKKGGFIAYHDFGMMYPDVKRFVEQKIVPKYELMARRGTLIIFKK